MPVDTIEELHKNALIAAAKHLYPEAISQLWYAINTIEQGIPAPLNNMANEKLMRYYKTLGKVFLQQQDHQSALLAFQCAQAAYSSLVNLQNHHENHRITITQHIAKVQHLMANAAAHAINLVAVRPHMVPPMT